MPKPKLSLLPPRQVRIDAVVYSLPGQGEQKTFLKVPGHPELLAIQDAARAMESRFAKNYFPSATGTPFPVSRALLHVALMIHLQQCAEDGGPLPTEEAFSETEALDFCGSSAAFYEAFLGKYLDYQEMVEQDPKNSSPGDGANSSPPASDAGTLIPASSTS